MSQFSRSDYIWLAHAWRELIDAEPVATHRETLKTALNQFADMLALQSDGFDRDRFLTTAFTRSVGSGIPKTPNKDGHCNG